MAASNATSIILCVGLSAFAGWSFAPAAEPLAPRTAPLAVAVQAAEPKPTLLTIALHPTVDGTETLADLPDPETAVAAIDVRVAPVRVYRRHSRHGADVAQWSDLIAEASERFGVPVAWIRAVMANESGGHTSLTGTTPIRSRMGAMGLMQVMPATYAYLRREYGFGPDPYDPHDNIFAGVAYLSELRARYGYPGLFAAYNHGPANFDRHLATGRALPRETRDYLAAVTADVQSAIVVQADASAAADGGVALRVAL